LRWADSRGLYSLEKTDNSKAIRVNSFNILEENEAELENPEVIIFDGEPFLIDAKAYAKKIASKEENGFSFVNAITKGASPELIFGYKEYNIVEFDKNFYGVRQDSGPLNFQELEIDQIKSFLIADTTKGVMNQIDNLSKPKEMFTKTKNFLSKITKDKSTKNPNNPPVLIKELDDKNIVLFNGVYYSVPHSLGPLSLENESKKFINSLVKAKTIESLEDIINKKPPSENGLEISKSNTETKLYDAKTTQEYVETYNNQKIFKFENTWFSYPADGPEIDLAVEDYFALDNVLYDVSITGLKETIDMYWFKNVD
jgi:hypothetical protein